MSKTLHPQPPDGIDAKGNIRIRLYVGMDDPHYHLLKDKTPKELRALALIGLRNAATALASPIGASQGAGRANAHEPQIQIGSKPNKVNPAKTEFYGLGADYLARIQDQSAWTKK